MSKTIFRKLADTRVSFRRDKPAEVGGDAKVYRGLFDDKIAAVKVFHKHKQACESFKIEANQFCLLSHACIVEAYGYTKSPCYSIVMEYATRGSLDRFIFDRESSIDWEVEGYPFSIDTAKAMGYLHNMQVIHCDIKSANVLLFDSDKGICAKLADFGMAMTFEDAAKEQFSQGTPQWMAPEVYEYKIVPESDVYSFGVLLWEMANLSIRPWLGLSDRAIESAVAKGKTLKLSCTGPSSVIDIMKGCWIFAPKDRMKDEHILSGLCAGLERMGHTKADGETYVYNKRLSEICRLL